MKKTRLANLRKEDYDIYIGRAGKGKGGYYGNPYDGPDKAKNIHNFKIYFLNKIKNDAYFREKVELLRGKTLGCFCHPKPCHGQIYIDYLEGDGVQEPNKEQLSLFPLLKVRLSKNAIKYRHYGINFDPIAHKQTRCVAMIGTSLLKNASIDVVKAIAKSNNDKRIGPHKQECCINEIEYREKRLWDTDIFKETEEQYNKRMNQ